MTKTEKESIEAMTRVLAGEFVRCRNYARTLTDKQAAAGFAGEACGVKRALEWLEDHFGQNWRSCYGVEEALA